MSGEEVPASDLPDNTQSGQEVPSHDLPTANLAKSGEEVPVHDLPEEDLQEKYGGIGSQAVAGIEGLAQGVVGSTIKNAVESGLNKAGVSGFSPEDISGRESANPITHGLGEATGFAGSLLSGVGEAKVLGLAGEKLAAKLLPEATGTMAKIGQSVISNAVQAGLFQTDNEVGKALLGQGDPTHPVSSALYNMGAAGLLGGTFGIGAGVLKGAVGYGAKKGEELLQKHLDIVPGDTEKLLAGASLFGKTPEELEKLGPLDPAMKKGLDFMSKTMDTVTGEGAKRITSYLLEQAAGFLPGGDNFVNRTALYILGGYLEPKAAAIIAKKAPALALKLIGENPSSGPMQRALLYTLSALKGEGALASGVSSIFDYGSSKAVDYTDPSKDIEDIKEHIDSGGSNKDILSPEKQHFAEGGFVNHPDSNLQHFPDQNMLLAESRGRISNYLSSMKPQESPRLPFDRKSENKGQQKKYDQALLVAARPMSILNDVKKGTLTPDQLVGFRSMYPEIYQNMSQKMTKHITEHQVDEKRPPRHLRQSLSLFLGANLESALLPQNILAAQSAFIQKQAQRQAANSKSSLSKLGKNAMTDDQSREQRLGKG